MRTLKLAVFAVLMAFAPTPMREATAQQGFGAWNAEKKLKAAEPDKFPLPKVAIVGADKPVELGELVDITLSPVENTPTLVSTNVVWKVYDYDPKGGVIEKKVREYSDGSVSFGAGIKDKKMLIVAAVTHLYIVKDGDKVSEVATKTQMLVANLVIGVPPPPKPPAPPTPPNPPAPKPVILPDGKFKLAQFSYDNGVKVVAASRVKGAAESTKAFRGVISAVRAGAISDQKVFLQNLKQASDAGFDNAKIKRSDWDAFGSALEAKLWALYHDDKKLVTIGDFADAVEEVCVGLDAVK